MSMDCIRKQTYQCAQHNLKIVYKKHDSRNTNASIFFAKEIDFFFVFPRCSTREKFFNHVPITYAGLTLTDTSKHSLSTFYISVRNFKALGIIIIFF